MAESMRWSEGFIAVDWGTTNRRAYVVDASGKPGAEFEDSKGVLSVAKDGFPAGRCRNPRAGLATSRC